MEYDMYDFNGASTTQDEMSDWSDNWSGLSDSDGNALEVGMTVVILGMEGYYQIDWIRMDDPSRPIVGGMCWDGMDWSQPTHEVTVV